MNELAERWDRDLAIELAPLLGLQFRPETSTHIGLVPGRRRNQALGLYLRPEHTADGKPQFYIDPTVDDEVTVARVLARLLIEQALCDGKNERLFFSPGTKAHKFATEAGLIFERGQWLPRFSPGLEEQVNSVIEALGRRPHARPIAEIPKARTWAMKAECPICRSPIRVTRKALRTSWPICWGNGQHQPYLLDIYDSDGVSRLEPGPGVPHQRDNIGLRPIIKAS